MFDVLSSIGPVGNCIWLASLISIAVGVFGNGNAMLVSVMVGSLKVKGSPVVTVAAGSRCVTVPKVVLEL